MIFRAHLAHPYRPLCYCSLFKWCCVACRASFKLVQIITSLNDIVHLAKNFIQLNIYFEVGLCKYDLDSAHDNFKKTIAFRPTWIWLVYYLGPHWSMSTQLDPNDLFFILQIRRVLVVLQPFALSCHSYWAFCVRWLLWISYCFCRDTLSSLVQ